MLPLILQHVRELADAQSAGPERDRYKIITPFPPDGQGWPTFSKEALEFNDPPREGDSASLDTVRAFEFYRTTDSLYYDYSYGIRSEDYSLSQVCQKFFLNAREDTSDLSYRTTFSEKQEAFLRKYSRSTVGDLGLFPYKYTSLSPVSWSSGKVTLASPEIERLQFKAMAVYQELEGVELAESLVEELRSTSYSVVEYDFGFFDVIREWLDPHLFEGRWEFASGDRTLYGEADAFFESNDVSLCFAQRFYLVKNCQATTATPTSTPEIRDHRVGRLSAITPARFAAAGGGTLVADGGPSDVRDRRRVVRNELIRRTMARAGVAPAAMAAPAGGTEPSPAAPPPRAGFVWVPATAGVAGHWERERAGVPRVVEPPDETTYRVAAIKCRTLPRRP
jgi:hypothetical protein